MVLDEVRIFFYYPAGMRTFFIFGSARGKLQKREGLEHVIDRKLFGLSGFLCTEYEVINTINTNAQAPW